MNTLQHDEKKAGQIKCIKCVNFVILGMIGHDISIDSQNHTQKRSGYQSLAYERD